MNGNIKYLPNTKRSGTIKALGFAKVNSYKKKKTK